jgi:hypothetical protein
MSHVQCVMSCRAVLCDDQVAGLKSGETDDNNAAVAYPEWMDVLGHIAVEVGLVSLWCALHSLPCPDAMLCSCTVSLCRASRSGLRSAHQRTPSCRCSR